MKDGRCNRQSGENDPVWCKDATLIVSTDDEREKIRKCQIREDLSGIKKNFNRRGEPNHRDREESEILFSSQDTFFGINRLYVVSFTTETTR
jgi:hypothetical protein